MIKGILFDFDGTLTELTLDFSGMRIALEKVALKYVSPEAVRESDGLFMLEMIYAIEKRLGEAGPGFRNEAFTLLRDIEVEAADGKEVYPYTRPVLRSLREMGMRLGVMTRNCGGAVRKVFPDVDEYVDAMVTRDDVPIVKPDPSHPEAVLDRLGVEPREALLVGDHPSDIQAGRSAGLQTVGVLSGRIKKEELANAGADFVVADIRDILSILGEAKARGNRREGR